METQTPPPSNSVEKKQLRVFLAFQCVFLVLLFVVLLRTGVYGWTLFLAVPFSLGVTGGYYSKTFRSRGFLKGSFLILALLAVGSILLILAGLEGAICILMAEGILILPAFLGALIGYAIRNMYLTHMIGFVLLLNTSFTYYDTVDKDGIESLATETILIHASQAKIWDVLSHRVRFTAHGNLFFRAGVSHPTSMQLSYDNNKKCFLNCELSNGFAALAIEKLDSLRQIRFSIPDEVRTMKELTFYDSLDAPHLQGYFDASYGEFIIKPISENQCQLIANTKYKYRITPAFYWQWWSDYLVNAMHRHVLEDIRALAESK